ncbi:DUF2490 domain-containing protein [uncultured Algibacter sp.]|uniref:DUF2490 domain-containing protein n=1 Tax=uncultured Algibacter sp. TaxID=298659 RepID=UPI002619B7A5|nr:DUF2490 domain-containing protein [uncultured Algibacter sp.]
MLINTKLKNQYSSIQFILILGVLFQYQLSAQQRTEILIQPQISFNLNSDKLYSQNFSLAHRSFLYKDKWGYKGRQFDFSHFSTLALSSQSKLSLGAMYRNIKFFDVNDSNEFRLTQQYNFNARHTVIRFGHRFRVEERFLRLLTIFRFRYRFAIDFPLKGQKLDKGELYSIINLEMISSLSKVNNPEYDGRFMLGIGKLLLNDAKIQFLIEYRKLDITNTKGNQLFSYVSLHLKL